MADKEIPPPPGCWSFMVGVPIILLFSRFEEQWRHFVAPLIPSHLSAEAANEIYAFSCLGLILVVWEGVLKLVDLTFGTRLFGIGLFGIRVFGRGPAPPSSPRAKLRRSGILIALSVATLDQVLKALFGAGIPFRSDLPFDAVVVADGLGFLMFAVFWWMSRTPLTSLATSLLLGSGMSFAVDLALGRGPFAIPIHTLGLSFVFTPYEIAVITGLGLYALSWFWDPGELPADSEK